MTKLRAAITGVAGYAPEYILNNEELSRMVDTTDEWIMTRIGIRERHILKGEGLASSDMGAEAVKMLLEKTKTSPEEVDLVICATVTPDMMFPATANIISDKCGITNAFSYDMNAACSSFLYALTVGQKFVESGTHKKVIIVGSDKMSAITDYTDRSVCPLFGDAAAAVMLEPTMEEVGVIDSIFQTNGVGRQHLHMKAGGSLKPASHATVDAKEHFIYLKAEDLAWLVPHQANMRIIDAVANRMGLEREKVMINIERYGNTTSATIPLCLWEWESKLRKGDNVILAAFGGGFTWGSTLLKWAYDTK